MLAYDIFDNPLEKWLIALGLILVFYFSSRLIKAFLLKRLGKGAPETETDWDDFALEALRCLHPAFLLIVSLYFGLLPITLPVLADNIKEKLFLISLLMQVARLGSRTIRFMIERYRRQQLEKNAEAVTTLSSVAFLLRIVLWVILILVALDNFGINVTTLIAGLGISGIAVALAVQNILGDLFASFSIVLDKPFIIGDFIIVGDHMGTVEYVGLKTTRVRSLSGEQLIFSNADLLGSRIRNFKRMRERRIVFSIGVVYQTPAEKIEAVPAIIRDIIESQDRARFDRAHFKEYGPSALIFEIVYWIQNPDYNIYMDIQQAINLAIFRVFDQEGIAFAYPTQTLILSHEKEPEKN